MKSKALFLKRETPFSLIEIIKNTPIMRIRNATPDTPFLIVLCEIHLLRHWLHTLD